MRQHAGEPERRMWHALREAFPEARFRRQVPLGPYFADFCSHAARLVIEIDGDSHAGTDGYDKARADMMAGEGYRTLRFPNTDITANLDGVLTALAAALPYSE